MADPSDFAADAMQYASQLYGAAMRLTRNSSDAEDLVQETYLRGYRGYANFEAGSNLRAWLFRILTKANLSETDALQRRIWSRALSTSQQPGASADAEKLLLPALNQMIDITTTRTMAS